MRPNKFIHLSNSLGKKTQASLSHALILKTARKFVSDYFKNIPLVFHLSFKNKILTVKTANKYLFSELRFLKEKIKNLNQEIQEVKITPLY